MNLRVVACERLALFPCADDDCGGRWPTLGRRIVDGCCFFGGYLCIQRNVAERAEQEGNGVITLVVGGDIRKGKTTANLFRVSTGKKEDVINM